MKKQEFESLHLDPSLKKSIKSYIIGFTASILLTLASYFAVVEKLLTGWVLVAAIITLGLIQAWIQLVFFLSLGKESKPRWNLLIFSFMTTVVLILVLGSLWIMYNLNYRVMDVS